MADKKMAALDAGAIYSKQTIEDIHTKAQTGNYKIRGFGRSKDVPKFDDIVILPAQASIAPVDKYREPCNTKVKLGTRFAKKPLEADTPVLIGGMSFGALSKEAKLGLAKGSAMVGSVANTGEGGMLPEERELSDKLVVQYSSGRFGVSAKYLNAGDAVEVKIGQGAKPGMGGHLMAEKVSPEVAKIREIPEGTDALSPCRFLDSQSKEELAEHIELIREVTDWEVPIIVKLGPGRVDEDVKIAYEVGADIIALDGMEGGTGASPEIVSEETGVPTIPALALAVKTLEEIGAKDDVDLIITGGIRNGADVAKALAMGADAVYIATASMIAMGCIGCRNCSKGTCPVGIATQNPKLRTLDVDEAAEHVANYINAITEEAKMLAQLAGHDDLSKLNRTDLRVLSNDVKAMTGLKLVGE
ncbi:FMN-binding glutamate synthase family protein [Candidatus Methanosphaera massiliense]|jgi:glutamate synthase domain-containing protein 2|uniref:FMN-binding glutamate synthase family protein n=1 Tax=Methanosphaera TaxID=2316 RepID=UPI00237FF674|nr:FMN-binding glutamate synthase family protein [Candidatus Methanosphaera massiliense]MDD6285547.1 FMN-binding glutamate synthase family protein [Methanobacteriaceae archaeon]MDE4078567.1 FMN-binding glutamate synthase family protein [Candidatus Methanosphaera massiliense]MDY2744854.1 FMN-binding glutamate synthase family protein [Methanosphaera sp.]